jgi:hypothetical protein
MALATLRAPIADRGNDLYETPEVATEALLCVENLPPCIWEPACGPGAIVRVLRRHGHTVLATDLVDYESPDQDAAGWDFFFERHLPFGIQAIVTNPPFKNADAFVAHALDLCPRVMMLLRLAFLESERRTPILDSGHLARAHVFKKRLPMMHRAGWQGPRASSSLAFAWFVWDRDHHGPIQLDRIPNSERTHPDFAGNAMPPGSSAWHPSTSTRNKD